MDKIKLYDAKLGRVILARPVVKSEAEWKKLLTAQQFEVTAHAATEPPYTSSLAQVKENGLFRCIRCGTDLFRSSAQFDSGTGWPSFYEPVSELNIRYEEDHSFGQLRTAVRCARCGAQLGHVFNDGPPPTFKRYCLNGAALKFVNLSPPL
ncbi:MAG: peptide-methionine (R)-S-oxide reductase MsrB [Candidatus Saganbacteria bacterium]|nr:peptide-methionine (R)-S-oxide reductase MsrB [Candidatus Saganbacteria bacterium]